AVEVFSEVFFACDIILKFNVAIQGEEGTVTLNRKKIAIRYLLGSFSVDLFSTFPWCLVMGEDFEASTPSGIRLIRLVKLSSWMRFNDASGVNMQDMFSHPLFRVAKLVAIVMLMVHLFVCLIHNVALKAINADIWLGYPDILGESNLDKYFYLLYFTTSTMVGERSLPQDRRAVLCTLLVFWLGTSIYITCFTEIMRLMQTYDVTNTDFRKKMDRCLSYLNRMRVPPRLSRKITNYFTKMQEETKGVDSQEFLQELPKYLRQEMVIFLNQGIIENMPLFQDCSYPFLNAILMRLRVSVCFASHILCCEGDMGDEMYIIVSGEFQFAQKGQKLGTLLPGMFFGEGALLETHGRRMATVYATKTCTFYSLSKEDFDEVSQGFPEEANRFIKEGRDAMKASIDIHPLHAAKRSQLKTTG
ncbi:hypothetical protein CYMTET_28659, partial [Cymbomonas tetramitiformis]